ncbi:MULTISPECIES: MCE family protein [unclassified Mycobacterium]|uniref:MCE family protein n=1 Tax=unclassified Mycobacterium TaxID=2642494 RepID=UPI00073FAE45|nr:MULTISPECIES: MCE family protein [unclassified Mycobacterium]KUH82937.1 mammalian cell entry protein [Mycobacterium sp. IS-1556]KUH83284.1 mammalian cell entry protein [Mycobacterium sp. GA-0227b]KUH84306.1 mammalian cell entry protein [Mycobacterium sp. GA-1999]
MSRRTLTAATAGLLAIALIAATTFLINRALFAPKSITADFASATAIYPGDQVRVAGVKVGTITSIDPQATFARVTMDVDRGVPIPADAKAVIVAQNLISARYVQLTPAYRDTGPQMADGAQIPLGRTAVPVEWDEVKTQLTRLATELGPNSGRSDTATGRFIDSAANAMAGNGDKLRQTLAQLSGVGRILADGSGNIVEIVKNLHTFITALRDSSTQIVEFQGRLATLTSVLDGSKSDLDAALTNVSEVVGEVERFVRTTRTQTAEQVQRLANVTQNVVDHQKDLEQILHVAPTAIANTLNMFDPRDGGATGIFTLSNISSPVQFLCGAIGAIENTTASETAKLCAQYLGPALRLMNFNYLPFPFNPLLASIPPPEDFVYTDPALAPGGSGAPPGPPETPPAVSAYTGVGDVPPSPGYGPPPPPAPTAATGLPDLLLPPAPQSSAAAPLPAEQPAREGTS